MNVRLSPEHEALVRAKIASGDYRDEAEVIGDALAALDQREEHRRAALLTALEEGEAALRRGDSVVVRTDEELHALFAKL
jgi:putative addiction module CopG family antidote